MKHPPSSGLIVVGILIASIAAACDMAVPKSKAARAPSAAELRAKAGPYIASTKQLSDTEEISTLVLPSRIGAMLDAQCFIYKNKEFKQAVVTCQDDRLLDTTAIEQN
jgi:hypothetical protein